MVDAKAMTTTISKSLFATVFKVSFLSGLAMVFYFGVEILIVFRLGISAEADAFFIALTIPRVLFALSVSVGGALIPVLVPTGRPLIEINNLYVTIFNYTLLILGALVLLGIFFSSIIVAIIGPGLSEETAQQATILLRILLPSSFFSGLAAILMSILNAHEYFTQAVLSNLARSIGILGGMVLLSGYGAVGLSLGWVLGSFIQFAITLGISNQWRVFRYQPHLRWRDPALGEVWRLTRTALWGIGTQQTTVILERIIGSFLPAGTITALNYTTNIMRVGGTLVIQSTVQVSLPALITKISQGMLDQAHQLFIRNLRFVTYFIFPIVAILMTLSLPLCTLLLQRGAVTASQVSNTASLLSLASIWLICIVFFRFAIMYLYARRHTKTIIRCYAIFLGGYILWGGLIGWYGAGKGLALTGSLSLLPGALYGLWALKIPRYYWKPMITYISQLTAAAMIMGGSMLSVANISSLFFEALPSMVSAGLILSFGLISGGIVWLSTTMILGIPETIIGGRIAWDWTYSRLRKLSSFSKYHYK